MATPAEIFDINTQRESDAFKERQKIELWQMIGGIKVVNQVVASLGAQGLRAIEQVRDRKLYIQAGHETFREFLDNDTHSPMSYDQFNRRIKLLETEGDAAFDLLNSINVPQSTRKLLAGQIEIEGNELRVGDQHIRTDDQTAILNLITTQHAKLLEQQRTIERGKKDVDRFKRKVDEAEKRAVVANPSGTATGQAVLTAAGALTHLRESLEAASDEEKEALREPIFELLRVNSLELSAALGVATKDEVRDAKSGDDDLGVTDEELTDLVE